jgi:hypothetical protein
VHKPAQKRRLPDARIPDNNDLQAVVEATLHLTV